MNVSRQQKFIPWTGLLAVVVLSLPAVATELEMAKLPSSVRFSCALCHVITESGIQTDLNPFGLDFRDFGAVWSLELADEDSDGDGCTNGAELGDVDANGTLDDGILEESSNPGNPGDCTSANIDSMTWSELKELFNGRR